MPPKGKSLLPRPRPTPPEPENVSPAIAVVRRPVIPYTVKHAVCQTMAVVPSELSGSTRHPRVVWARRIITRLCRIYTTISYPEIAALIGRPSHSTVITADQLLDRLLTLPAGDPKRMVPVDLAPDDRGVDVQAVLDAVAKIITRTPLVVAANLPERPS